MSTRKIHTSSILSYSICHAVSSTITSRNITQHRKQNVFSSFVGSFGSFWLVLLVVLGGFSCFWLVWLVTTNVLHKHSLCKWKLRQWKSKSAYTLFCFIRILFFRPRLNILIFLPIFGWSILVLFLNDSIWHLLCSAPSLFVAVSEV